MRSPGLPFADRFKCRLQSRAVFAIADPDSFSDIVISGNSAFDPFAALSATQPTYYDQLSALYGNVVCHASHVKFFVLDTQSAVLNRQFRCGIAPRDSSTAFNDASDLLLQARAKQKDVNMAGGEPSVSNSVRTVEVLGLKDVFQTQALSTAAVSCVHPTDANPSSEWFWHLTVQTLVAGTNIAVDMDLIVQYDLEFFDRQAQSTSFLERALDQRKRREEYLKLKAATPDKSGRIPRPAPNEALRDFVESKKPACVGSGYVMVSEPAERKFESRPAPVALVQPQTPCSVKLSR